MCRSTATLVSVTPSLAIYNVSAPSAGAIAVFDGATKLATFYGDERPVLGRTGQDVQHLRCDRA